MKESKKPPREDIINVTFQDYNYTETRFDLRIECHVDEGDQPYPPLNWFSISVDESFQQSGPSAVFSFSSADVQRTGCLPTRCTAGNGNGSTTAIGIFCQDVTSCARDLEKLSSGHLASFNVTRIGETAVSSYQCDVNTTTTINYRVTRECVWDRKGNFRWLDPVYTPCEQFESAGEALKQLGNEDITPDEAESVSDVLVNLTSDTTQLESSQALQDVSNIITIVISVSATPEVAENVIDAVNNILELPESTFQEASNDAAADGDGGSGNVANNILTSINTLTAAVQNNSNENFTYSGDNIVVAAVKVNRATFPLTAKVGSTPSRGDQFNFTANSVSPVTANDAASVSLPEAILDLVPENNQDVAISVFLLDSPKLFQDTRNTTSLPVTEAQPFVASSILSVTIEGAKISGLPDDKPVTLQFPVNQSYVTSNQYTARCAFWNATDNGGAWSSVGVTTRKTSDNDGLIICDSYHLTSFCVLMDTQGNFESRALSVISLIGCIFSVVCLVITLTILLGIRKIRKKQPNQILINLCFAMLGLYLVFAVGSDKSHWGHGCTTVAILLHFFCLASVTWMGVEAFNMYLMFVRVMNVYTSHMILKCCIVGWGVPLVVTVVSVASKWSAYQHKTYCFVEPGLAFYLGLLLPIAVILAFNSAIFVVVTYRLTCGRKVVSKASALEKDGDKVARMRAEVIRRAQNAIAIGTLLGLTWVFGFMALGGARLFFNYIFAILNSLQGVFVFLLFGMRQPEVRDLLKAKKGHCMSRARGSAGERRKSSGFDVSTLPRMTTRASDVTLLSYSKKPSICAEMSDGTKTTSEI
ncbi:adhesion G-protein coupled receptor G2-like [Diadema antillarum]|uniref:adhesion G-protein coupled receptor G2-like n=1 Tax=Diadema antillarum TaxID=105358 RepID=UPI003A88B1F1